MPIVYENRTKIVTCQNCDNITQQLTEDAIDFETLKIVLNEACKLFVKQDKNISCTSHVQVDDIGFYKSMLTGEWGYQIDIKKSVIDNVNLIEFLKPYIPPVEATWIFNTYW